jgi:hypothetical protein
LAKENPSKINPPIVPGKERKVKGGGPTKNETEVLNRRKQRKRRV